MVFRKRNVTYIVIIVLVNNYVVGYLAWRIITGRHKDITLSFMRVGHTRCLVDGHFGLIKKIYRQCDTDTLSQMCDVVKRSSTNNVPQLFDWEWRQWDAFFPKFFKRIPLITKYQHFYFLHHDLLCSFARHGTQMKLRLGY